MNPDDTIPPPDVEDTQPFSLLPHDTTIDLSQEVLDDDGE